VFTTSIHPEWPYETHLHLYHQIQAYWFILPNPLLSAYGLRKSFDYPRTIYSHCTCTTLSSSRTSSGTPTGTLVKHWDTVQLLLAHPSHRDFQHIQPIALRGPSSSQPEPPFSQWSKTWGGAAEEKHQQDEEDINRRFAQIMNQTGGGNRTDTCIYCSARTGIRRKVWGLIAQYHYEQSRLYCFATRARLIRLLHSIWVNPYLRKTNGILKTCGHFSDLSHKADNDASADNPWMSLLHKHEDHTVSDSGT